ncbi:Filamin-binding LIM protein 1 [Tupaia chinensis]|uniref:Filamin-binding LIM protein 1 n=1 Tax=Tupaia chinensis TaxID=246437 RepID=L9L0X1_TUPCH|nr:Filamin-binding LIM protein 1 [Tupaia chinensis]
MASKPEKRVASSVFITLAPPRRDVAVAEEVRPAACEARRGRPWESSTPMKAPGVGPTGRPSPWTPPGRPVAAVPAVPPQLSNGGLIRSESSLFRCSCPQAPEDSPAGQPRPGHLRPSEDELPPPPEEAAGFPDREATTDICAFCHKSVSPRELAVEAMKRQYHAQCFTCRICRRQLAGQSFYQKDGRPLCEPCYQDTLEKCGKCGEVVQEHIIRALGQAFHPSCFTCVTCARCIGDESFALDNQNEVYCLDDFYRKFAPVCSICENPIIPRDGKDAFKIECMGRNFHENCYRCEDCRILLSVEPTDQGCYPLNDRLFCKPCHVKRSAAGCC